jgi:hypothetical protein
MNGGAEREVLQFKLGRRGLLDRALQDDVRLDDARPQASRVRRRGAGTFGNVGMPHQNLLDLDRRYRMAAADDHLVAARDVDEAAVLVPRDKILKHVPAIAHGLCLSLRIVQVVRAGRPAHAEQSRGSARHRRERVGVANGDFVARDRSAHCPGLGRGHAMPDADEDIQKLGRAQELLERYAGRARPRAFDLDRQRLAAAQRHSQLRQLQTALGDELAQPMVVGRNPDDDGDAERGHRLDKPLRRLVDIEHG